MENIGIIFGLLFGLLIVVLGIYVKVHNHRLHKYSRKVAASVVYTEPIAVNVLGQSLPGHKNVIEIVTGQGVITKELVEECPREVGSYVRGYYDESNDKFMKESDVKTNEGAGPYIMIASGLVICAIMILVLWMQNSQANAEAGGRIFGYIISVVFVIAGAWVGIGTPLRRKKEMINCHTVPGTLVDYKAEADDNGTSYFPVYEYYVYGEPRRIGSTVGGSAAKYRQIGRQVSIVINDKTGETYCAEDNKASGKLGILFLVIGLVVLAILVYQDVKEHKDKQAQDTYQSESMTGGAGHNGNISVKPTEFDVDAFREALNAENYCYTDVIGDMPQDMEFVEYFYTPSDFSRGTFAYHVALYENGVGQLTLFPSVSVDGRSFHQYISFWCGPDAILQLGNDMQLYDFNKLNEGAYAGGDADYGIQSVGSGEVTEYIYYYDGTSRSGSGGTSVQTEAMNIVRGHFVEAVPDVIWRAADAEMQTYFEE